MFFENFDDEGNLLVLVLSEFYEYRVERYFPHNIEVLIMTETPHIWRDYSTSGVHFLESSKVKAYNFTHSIKNEKINVWAVV